MNPRVRFSTIISALVFLIALTVAGRSVETNVEALPWDQDHPTSVAAIKGSPEDEAAIRKIVAGAPDRWNRRDAEAMVAHFSEDHDHINVDGEWRNGKAETEKAMTAALATSRANTTNAIAKVRFVTPDVAIVVVRTEYRTDTETKNSISIHVFHKMNGEWRNEAFQNTLVRSREEAIAKAARASSPMAQVEPQVITPANSKMDFSEDVAAIRKISAAGTDAWNRRDAKALAAHISEDHDHIGVTGEWDSGRAQFEKTLTAAPATTRNNLAQSVAKIRFVSPDIAIVVARNEYSNEKETLKSISTRVFHKMNGEWWNEAFQNTYVKAP